MVTAPLVYYLEENPAFLATVAPFFLRIIERALLIQCQHLSTGVFRRGHVAFASSALAT